MYYSFFKELHQTSYYNKLITYDANEKKVNYSKINLII